AVAIPAVPGDDVLAGAESIIKQTMKELAPDLVNIPIQNIVSDYQKVKLPGTFKHPAVDTSVL
ncbi:MAG: hypothetical protein GY869_09310, partial [Planctomycetes bacterium]|nr:hypothetical protein [Planctomycetota bacterium]